MKYSKKLSFNSRSRVGSDRRRPVPITNLEGFQFTLPRGERHKIPLNHSARGNVSIHAPAWGATEGALVPPRRVVVSIHAPAWGATKRSNPEAIAQLFQFTLPRGERHDGSDGPLGWCPVSIHAPAWGATPAPQVDGVAPGVSIHAPAWGATFPRRSQSQYPEGFNSRSRVGSDDEPL